MDSRSPFACLLVGQPTFRRKIKLGILAALDQRIALRYELGPTATGTGPSMKPAIIKEIKPFRRCAKVRDVTPSHV